jgi:hypothetical protein
MSKPLPITYNFMPISVYFQQASLCILYLDNSSLASLEYVS